MCCNFNVALRHYIQRYKNVLPWFNESGLDINSLTYLIEGSWRKKARLFVTRKTTRVSKNFMIIAKKGH